MTEQASEPDPLDNPETDLKSRIDRIEQQYRENSQVNERRVALAELKVEALRAGIIDLDGLKFVDTDDIHLDEDGIVVGGADLIKQLKSAKPWLFSAPSSSSVARVPPARPAHPKLAIEMTNEEYLIAKANIIKRSGP